MRALSWLALFLVWCVLLWELIALWSVRLPHALGQPPVVYASVVVAALALFVELTDNVPVWFPSRDVAAN